MTDLENDVVRRTPYEVKGRKIVATMKKSGITLRPERTQQSHHIPWADLWRWAETADVHIPARKGK